MNATKRRPLLTVGEMMQNYGRGMHRIPAEVLESSVIRAVSGLHHPSKQQIQAIVRKELLEELKDVACGFVFSKWPFGQNPATAGSDGVHKVKPSSTGGQDAIEQYTGKNTTAGIRGMMEQIDRGLYTTPDHYIPEQYLSDYPKAVETVHFRARPECSYLCFKCLAPMTSQRRVMVVFLPHQTGEMVASALEKDPYLLYDICKMLFPVNYSLGPIKVNKIFLLEKGD